MQPEQALKWIQEDLTDGQIKEFLEYQIPVEEIDYCPVFTIRTTKQRPDSKGKIDAYQWPNLPDLGTDGVHTKLSLYCKFMKPNLLSHDKARISYALRREIS